jgi:hypothetical protein
LEKRTKNNFPLVSVDKLLYLPGLPLSTIIKNYLFMAQSKMLK